MFVTDGHPAPGCSELPFHKIVYHIRAQFSALNCIDLVEVMPTKHIAFARPNGGERPSHVSSTSFWIGDRT
jgi:hypothetical protein